MYNKIVFVAPILNQIGGIEKTAYEIKETCDKANVQFSLFTLLNTSTSSFSLMEKAHWLFKLSLLLVGKTFSFFLGCYILGIKNSRLKESLDCSLIISRNAAMTYALILLKKKLRINCKIIYLPSHYSADLYYPIIEEAKKEKNIMTLIKNQRHVVSESFFEKRILADSKSQVITFSHNLLNRLKRMYRYENKKVLRVIRPGVSDSILKNQCNRSTNKSLITFLYVGRVDTGKNVNRLLELFSHADHNVFQLSIIGDGNLLQDLKNQYKENKNISFFGAMFGVELASAYKSASYLIIPTFFESYGHVISESLCSGTPVIGFSFPSCRNAVSELIQKGVNGLVITGDTQQEFDIMLHESKKHLAHFEAESAKLQLESRKTFSWRDFVDELLHAK
jgi:glycosyltransferase involved in cell wall biosynthesis